MTELQPSPTAYRGQDEAPGPPSCTQNKNIIKYSGHNHKIDSTNYKNINLYPQENYQQQQQLRVTNTSDHQYRHNNTDRRNTENDDNNIDNGKKLISYNDGFKKNTPGYKNDSG